MPELLFQLHLCLFNSCVCVSTLVHASPSISIFIYIYRRIHVYVLCSVLYSQPPFCLVFCYSINLIVTYVTVHIDARMTLLICLDSFSTCIFISLIPAYVYLNMYEHVPPLPYSYTFIAMFMCVFCVMFYIYNHLLVFFLLVLQI